MDRKSHSKRGFTLVELLIVIAIISVLIGLLLPVMSGVRQKAFVVKTETTMRDVTAAIQQFQASEGRLPGYFSAAEMSNTDNSGPNGQGFTEMENILLDIAGGIIPSEEYAADPTKFEMGPNNPYIEVGPVIGANLKVHVDLNKVGTEEFGGGYLILPREQLFPVQGQQIVNIADFLWSNGPAHLTHKGMPDVLDSFGQPIMAWRQDPSAPMRPTADALGATAGAPNYLTYWASYDQSTKVPTDLPGFYWASNSGYLASGKDTEGGGLGAEPVDQSAQSLIGFLAMQDLGAVEQGAQQHLAALLGSPAFPLERVAPGDPWRPAQTLGAIVLHSAGPNRVYLEVTPGKNAGEIGSVRPGANRVVSVDLSTSLVYTPTDGDAISYSGSPDDSPRSMGDFDDIVRGSGN